jgi:hypothetical protein
LTNAINQTNCGEEIMEQQDNGDWLSAQQAVRPDGTEATNLPLINKRLPPLVQTIPAVEGTSNVSGMSDSEQSKLG